MSRRSKHILSVTGTVVGVLALMWGVFTWFVPADTGPPSQNVEADRGGVAVGGDVGGDVSVGGSDGK